MIEAIQAMIWEYINKNPNYKDLGKASRYICWWVATGLTPGGKPLKVKSIQYEIRLEEDRVCLSAFDGLSYAEFQYADPGFPDTLYDRLPRVKS